MGSTTPDLLTPEDLRLLRQEGISRTLGPVAEEWSTSPRV